MVENVKRNFYDEKWKGTTKRTLNLLRIVTILFAVSLFVIWVLLLRRGTRLIELYGTNPSTIFNWLFIFIESYVEIPYVISIFFVIALWCLSREFEGRTKKVLGIVAILVAIPFLLDMVISTIGLILGDLFILGESGAFVWLYAMIVTYNLSDIIFYQIAFFILGIELWRMKKTLGLNTNMIFSSILGIVLVPITVGTGIIFYFSLTAHKISYWLQIMIYLVWTINCLEFAVQLFRWKPLENKHSEKLSEESDSRVSEINNGDSTKRIIIGGALLLMIYAGLWLIAQIILMIKGDPFFSISNYYRYLMVDFLDFINVIEFFGFISLGFGILLLDTRLKDERKDWKLLASGILLVTTILIEAIITVIFAIYRVMNYPLYVFSIFGSNYFQWLAIIFEVLKSGGLLILGFALMEKRKLKNWKTNLLITPFLYIITVITLVILDIKQIIYLKYDVELRLAIVLVTIAVAIELFIRVRKVDLPNQFQENINKF